MAHILISETCAERQPVLSTQRPGLIATGLYSLLFVCIEVLMQTVAFSFRHFNTTKQFPFSTATLVCMIELTVFVLCFLAFCGQHRRVRFVPSPIFLIPAFFFVTAINLFFNSLNFITLPTWNVLVQSRTVFTALGGYVIFGRPIGRRQWMATVPLLLAAGLAIWFCPEVDTSKPLHNNDSAPSKSLWWIVAVLCGAACSAFSIGSAEFISKLGSRPISEKHIQLHFFCTVLSLTWAELVTSGNLFEINGKMFFPLDFYLALLNLVVGTLGGLALTHITVNKLTSPADDASALAITAWVPPAIFLLSTVASLLFFSTQQGYPYIVSAVTVLLMGATSFLCTTSPSPPPPEKDRVALQQDA